MAKIADVGMSRPQCRELVSAQPIMTPLWAAPEVRGEVLASGPTPWVQEPGPVAFPAVTAKRPQQQWALALARSDCAHRLRAVMPVRPARAWAQVVSKQPASIKCDMWSFGVLIWELATGLDITCYQPLAVSRQMAVQVRAQEGLGAHLGVGDLKQRPLLNQQQASGTCVSAVRPSLRDSAVPPPQAAAPPPPLCVCPPAHPRTHARCAGPQHAGDARGCAGGGAAHL